MRTKNQPPRGLTIEQRFWRSVRKTESCWLWEGPKTLAGYGLLWTGAKYIYAHRYSFASANGDIEAGKFVLHACDIPRCVNPAHLRVGTQADNMQDVIVRGRGARGERHYMSKLTAAAVEELRTRKESATAFARRHGIRPDYARQVRRGVTWKCLGQSKEA
jgi:hypothetical protein